jgi:hypothetical protein
VPYESAREQWDAGMRRLDEAYPEQVLTLERVTREIQNELRRRLGGSFMLDELVDLYDEGTGWCTDLAVEVAPDEPFAWDARTVADAAFGRYARAATDYAGGRKLS